MALTQVSTDGIKNGTITGSDLATNFATTGDFTFTGDNANIIFDKDADNIRVFDGSSIDFGNSGDLKIHHTGNVNIIDDVQSKTISIQRGGTEQWKFGDGTFRGPDNKKIQLGNAQDLQIFHDGSNSKIVDSGTGSLLLLSNSFKVQNAAGTENQIIANENGTVDIYYDNVRKFRTNSTGVQIGTTSAPLLLDNLTSGDGGQDIGRVGLNRDNNSTSDRQIWNQYTVAPTVAKFNIFARPANDTGTAGNYLEVDPVNNNFDLPRDNLNLRIGASADLQIFHNGTDSRIVNTTGDLSVRGGVIKLASTTGEEYIRCTANSSVDLFHDNVVKLTTNSDGYRSNDNVKAQFGVGSDLQIYHDGSNSIIDSLTGDFYFRNRQASNGRFIFEAAIGEVGLLVNNNGSVDLYYDNSKKFETSSTGVTITGRLNMTEGIDIPDGGDNNTSLSIGSGNDLRLYHDGSNSFIKDRGTGNLYIRGDDTLFIQSDSGEDKLKATTNGSIELYFDNSKKFETTSTGIKTTGNVAANETIVQVLHANETQGVGTGFNGLHMIGSNTNVEMTLRSKGSGDIKLQSSADEDMAIFTPDGAVELYYDNSKKFETTADGVAVTNITNNQGLDLNGVGNNTCIRFMSTGSSPGHAYRINYHSPTNNIFNSPCISFDKTDTNGTFNSHIGAISDDGFHLADNKKLHLGGTGASGDLQIVHDGSNSRISDNGTGNLILDGNNVIIQSNDNSETIAKFITNGAVELYHNNSKKFETSSEGVKHTLSNNGTIRFDQTTTANDRFQSLQYSRSGNSRGDVSQIQIGEGNISEGRINIKTSAANAGMSGGVFISNGGTSFGSMSDIRLKTKVADISDALTDIAKIDTWKYTWKSDKSNTVHLGITAQSVNEVYPEVVEQTNSLNDDEGDTTEYLAVLHQELIPVCIAAIKELKAKVEILETEVAALKAA